MVNKVNSDLYSMPKFNKKGKLQHSINVNKSKKLLSNIIFYEFLTLVSKELILEMSLIIIPKRYMI